MLYERGQRQIWLVWAYLGSFFGPEGGPYGHKCVQFWKFILYFINWVVAQLSSSNTLGVMIEKLNFPQKTTHHPFFGLEGGSYGHKCVVWSTWTPTRKVEMIQTFPDKFEARMTPCYAILAWTKGNLVSLGVFGLVFWAWGWPPMATNVWYGPPGHWQGRWT